MSRSPHPPHPLADAPFERFAAVRLFGRLAYSPDGERLAYLANTSGQHNLWTQPVGPVGGGRPRQLTAFEAWRVKNFQWSPDGGRIAFTADHHGDEMDQVFVLDAAGGWPRRLTAEPEVQYHLAGWTPDGTRLVLSANDREPSEMDPLLLDPDSGARERLLTGGAYYAAEVSPDGRWLLLMEHKGNTDQDLILLELASGRTRPCTPHEGEVVFHPGPWKRDASGFYLVTNAEGEFNALASYDVERDAWEVIHAPDCDVEGVALARDGSVALVAENRDGASRLVGRRLPGGGELPLPELPMGVASQFDVAPGGERAALLFARPDEAANIYELPLTAPEGVAGEPSERSGSGGGAGGALRALEQSMLGGFARGELAQPELLRFASFDREVPAWLYRPAGPGPHPVAVSVHGGPEAQERPGYPYAGLYQFLLSRGIGVLAPNIRGSTGYGKSYQQLIHRDWGGAELEDIRHAAEFLRAQAWVDASRLAIFGGSFGGFVTLSALTRLPEYWALGVDLVGPSNLITFVDSVPPHWKRYMERWVGDPERDREALEARSPITHVERIRAPLLVIQGANDPRVVQAESDQMVERLRARGLEVEYYVDPEGGHGPADRQGMLRWMGRVAHYLSSRLTGEGANEAAAD